MSQPRKTLEGICKAIESKSIHAMENFLDSNEQIVAILNDGTVLENYDEFVDFIAEWFEDKDWSITHDLVIVEESPEMAYGVAECEYFDKDEEGKPYTATVFANMTLRLVNDRWLLVLFQQTELIDDEE